jgi:UPF0755 protein
MIIVPVGLIACILAVWQMGLPAKDSGAATVFEVRPGETGRTVAQRLESNGLIRNATYFGILARFRKDAMLRTGGYRISPAMTAREIFDILFNSISPGIMRRVTIPEGYTARQVAERVAAARICPENRFMEIVTDPGGNKINTHNNDLESLEGFLFPETYFFTSGDTCQAVAQKMVDEFFNRFDEDSIAAAHGQGFTLTQTVALASLIEGEAKHDDERAVISGVIHNRLRANMRLQIDATVQYALPEHKTRLLNRDLEVDSPYNTYQHDGLPPGAICSPGLPSLQAAIHPADVPYYYYVARPDGSHIFSRNSAEHAAAIREARRRRTK